MVMIALFHWWWDSVGLARAQVLTGAASSILAVIAIIYAWRVARRQLAIMDVQHKAFLDTLAIQPSLHVISGTEKEWEKPECGTIAIHNSGRQSAEDVHYEIKLALES